MIREVVILTCSYKTGGYCVAGLDIHNGDWVRMVSSADGINDAIPINFLTCTDGNAFSVYDVVTVNILGHVPNPIQPENYLVDLKIVAVRRPKPTPLQQIIDYAQYLGKLNAEKQIFGNIDCSIPTVLAKQLGYSLALVDVSNLNYDHTFNSRHQRKAKVDFIYKGIQYKDIYVTDPFLCDIKGKASYLKAYLILSLAENPASNGQHYKFLARML